MPKVMYVEFEGLRELDRKLGELGKTKADRVMRASVRAAAEVVRKQVKKNALPLRDTGVLDKNIIIKRIPKAETRLTEEFIVTVRQGKPAKRKQDRGATDAFYARFLEFGTVKYPAQHFIRTAFAARAAEATQVMIDRLRLMINTANR